MQSSRTAGSLFTDPTKEVALFGLVKEYGPGRRRVAMHAPKAAQHNSYTQIWSQWRDEIFSKAQIRRMYKAYEDPYLDDGSSDINWHKWHLEWQVQHGSRVRNIHGNWIGLQKQDAFGRFKTRL